MHHSEGCFLGSAVSVMTVGVILLRSAAAGARGELGMSAVPPAMKQVWPKAPQPRLWEGEDGSVPVRGGLGCLMC